MMGIFDGNAHLLQREHRFAAQVGGVVERRQIEIAALVDGLGSLVALEAEVFNRRANVHRIARSARAFERFHKNVARITGRGSAVGSKQIAEHVRHAIVARAPRQHLKRGRVGMHQHVGILQARQTLDGRAVETDALFKGRLDVGRRDGDVFQIAEDIGEPQSQEANVALFNLLDDILLGIDHVSS